MISPHSSLSSPNTRSVGDLSLIHIFHALHINDSLNPPGSHKDRHAKIGEGTIGLEAIANVIRHPKLQGLPCILETPNELPGYAGEIEILRAEYEK